jgi:hypothetical protein
MYSASIQIEGLTRDESKSHYNYKNHRGNPVRPKPDKNCKENQTHVHEFLGSTKLAERGDDKHNHRFAGVTGQVIPRDNNHVHAILINTDFFDHLHEIKITTGLAIPVGNGKHVHFVEGVTALEDEHAHGLQFATLIESPLT